MKVCHLKVQNFRGIRQASLRFADHAVLIGDNNTGKSTVLEALDLALGPDRLSRRPPVDEHDFFRGEYLAASGEAALADPGDPVAEGVPGDDGNKAVAAVAEEPVETALGEEEEKNPQIEK